MGLKNALINPSKLGIEASVAGMSSVGETDVGDDEEDENESESEDDVDEEDAFASSSSRAL
jgi:hypothetical protein